MEHQILVIEMKKTLALVAGCLLMAGSAMAQSSIDVKLSDLKTNQVVVELVNPMFQGVEKKDTLKVNKGQFTYTLNGDKARLAICNLDSPNGKKSFSLYMVPGEKGVLKGTIDQATWSGTAFYTDLATLEAQTRDLKAKMDQLTADYRRKIGAGANADSLDKVIDPLYKAASNNLDEAQTAFINSHPNSGAGVTVLPSLQGQEEALKTLHSVVESGTWSNFIDFVKAGIEHAKTLSENAKNVETGKMAPDFTLQDLNGNNLALSSLRGKYLVLDFWGSWCGWCIKGFPEMKDYYQKHASKLEILSIDCNDTQDKWKAAVQKNKLPWKNVYCPSSADVLKNYAISGFPTKIIIDPEGHIVKTVVGDNPAFYQYLDELLK